MNVRTCQMCGKPLSRLRGNVEGDFCSKEHKSQYRLRAGMNRLQEANKVASLMRRRENLRQMGPARLICNSAGAARLSDPPKLLSTQAEPAAAWPVFAISARSGMPVTPLGYRNPAPPGMTGVANPRLPNSSRIRIRPDRQNVALPKRRVAMPASLLQARISPIGTDLTRAKPKHRPFERVARSKTRVELGTKLGVSQRKNALGAFQLRQVSGTHNLRTSARKGKALRVSTAVGFHLPSARLRRYTSSPLTRNALVWPNRPYSTKPDWVGRPAGSKILEVGIPMPATRHLAGPRPARSSRFVQARTVGVPSSLPVRGSKPPARFSRVAWNPADPSWAGTVPGPESAGFSRRNGAHLFALAVEPFAIESLRQFAAAKIQVRETPVGYPKVVIQDTLAGAILSPTTLPPISAGLSADEESDPGEAVPVAAVQRRYEENFDAGWENWSGGMADWKVDIAGVRTGSLALFTPSMDLIDYDLEFLTRIDQRTVNWVVRAANSNEYSQCTLTAIPGGELEFSRSARFEGGAEAPVTAAARITAKPKSALTVRTRVQGQTFTVTVNGTPMETWTDTRLAIGGIGFLGTPEDRARLYWIRLATTESTGKEHRKR